MTPDEKRKAYLKIYRARPEYKARHVEYQRTYLTRKRGGIPPVRRWKINGEYGKLGTNWECRVKVLEHYGGRCTCCGETELKFLAIDHIDGGGTQHRKKVGNVAMWLVRQGFPEGFQILCHNCNQAKGYYGECPHTVLTQPQSETLITTEFSASSKLT